MNFSRPDVPHNATQQMFGEKSFVEFSLANRALSGVQAHAELGNACRVELWENGVLYFEPQNHDQASSVLISCGVHGNETAPIELVDQLVSGILAGNLKLDQRVLVVFANPRAANRQERFIDENLNRLFCGRHEQADVADSIEGKRARFIEQVTERFFDGAQGRRMHYDLHTAIRGSRHEKFAVYPFLHDRAHSVQQLGFLEQCGIQAVLLSNQPSTTYSYYSSTRYMADSFTVELGSVNRFGQNDLSKFTALEQSLTALLIGDYDFSASPNALQLYSVIEEVKKRSENLQFGFPDDAYNFTAFDKGAVLVSDQDYQYVVKKDGECIVFPHQNVPVGHRALLVVAPTQLNPGE